MKLDRNECGSHVYFESCSSESITLSFPESVTSPWPWIEVAVYRVFCSKQHTNQVRIVKTFQDQSFQCENVTLKHWRLLMEGCEHLLNESINTFQLMKIFSDVKKLMSCELFWLIVEQLNMNLTEYGYQKTVKQLFLVKPKVDMVGNMVGQRRQGGVFPWNWLENIW